MIELQLLSNRKCFTVRSTIFNYIGIFKKFLLLFLIVQRIQVAKAIFIAKPLNFFNISQTFPVERNIDLVYSKNRRESNILSFNKFIQNEQNRENLTNNASIIFNETNVLEPHWNHPLLGILLITMTIITISGNFLVILAVVRERYLKSATNYYIASLAVADLIVGLVVMPFNSLNKMTNDFWFFGDFWCDIWHSLDVFASTASINSLLFIALDRHSAISDPINYPTRWLSRYWVIFVALIWICSAFISFPAIAYWRWTTKEYILNRCIFSDDIYYLVFSSLVSFYIPLTIMVVVYIRIYRAATNQMNAIKTGQKLNVKTGDGSPLTLRIHRGGYHKLSKVDTNMGPNSYKKSSFRTEKPSAISNSNDNSKNNEIRNLTSTRVVSLSLSDLPSLSTAKNSPPGVKHSLEKTKFHQIKSSSNSVINKSHVYHQRRFSCPHALNLGLVKISDISNKSYIELNKKYLRNNSLLENRINFSSLSSSLSMSSLFLKSPKTKTINFLYYPSLLTKNKFRNKNYCTNKNDCSSVQQPMIKKFLSSLNEDDLNDLDVKESIKPCDCQVLGTEKIKFEKKSNETENLLSDLDKETKLNNQQKNESNEIEQKELSKSNNLIESKEKLVNQEHKFKKISTFPNLELDFQLNNKVFNSMPNSNICLNESKNKKNIDLLDLYTGNDETIRKNLLFYQKHYIEHTQKLMQMENSQNEINSKKNFIKNKYSTFKKLLTSQTTNLPSNAMVIKKHQLNSFAHSRHNSNLSAHSSLSQTFLNEIDNQSENEKLSNGRFKFFKQGKNYVTEKLKNLSITKKLSKFSREQKAAKTLGIVMGVFIICWLPFFIYNVITGIFKASLSKSHEFIYSMVTWLGYINSGCNPIIYSFSSRDFRRAFSKILFPKSFLLKNKRLNITSGPSHVTNNLHYDFTNNALYQNRKNFKIPPRCITCQMYENSLFTLTSKVAVSNLNESPVASKQDSEQSILKCLPSIGTFPNVTFDQGNNKNESINEPFKIAIKNVPLFEQEKCNSFELVKYNLIKLNSLVDDNQSDKICKYSRADTASDENEIFKKIQEKTHSFSSSILATETSIRESKMNKPLTKFTRNLRRTFRNVLNQNTKSRRAATMVYNKNKRFNDNPHLVNNAIQRRRTSGSSMNSSISLTVLNRLHNSANQTNKRFLKKTILLTNNISDELNSLSNASINSNSNPSLNNIKNNKNKKTISVGTTIKFKQTKLQNSQEKELSNSSFQMSLNKKHINHFDVDSQNSSVKKSKNKKNQRQKIQIFSFKTPSKHENKIEQKDSELLKTTPIPIAIDDDDYFTQIDSNLERQKNFASNNTYPISLMSKQVSVDKNEKCQSSNGSESEQITQIEEKNKPHGSSLVHTSSEIFLDKPLKNHDATNFTNLSPSFDINIENLSGERLKNGMPQIITLELNSENNMNSSNSKSLKSNNNANFPFGAKFFELQGEYSL